MINTVITKLKIISGSGISDYNFQGTFYVLSSVEVFCMQFIPFSYQLIRWLLLFRVLLIIIKQHLFGTRY